MNDGADAVAVVIWNIVQRHELCVAGEDLVPVDLGGDALAADFFNVRYAAAVDLFAVGFLQTFADGVGGGALGERGVLEQLCFVHRAVVDGSDLKHALRERAGFIEHDDFCIGEGFKIVGALEMARRSRGTPRLANRLLKRVRDFAQVKYEGVITEEVARQALDLLDVDRLGLDHVDRNLLTTMIEKFQGGPVGLDTLAAAIGEDAGTVEDVYEPYLLKNGFLQRTPRGRVVTDLAYTHLGFDKNEE